MSDLARQRDDLVSRLRDAHAAMVELARDVRVLRTALEAALADCDRAVAEREEWVTRALAAEAMIA